MKYKNIFTVLPKSMSFINAYPFASWVVQTSAKIRWNSVHFTDEQMMDSISFWGVINELKWWLYTRPCPHILLLVHKSQSCHTIFIFIINWTKTNRVTRAYEQKSLSRSLSLSMCVCVCVDWIHVNEDLLIFMKLICLIGKKLSKKWK